MAAQCIWGELPQESKDYYLAFFAEVANNVRVVPQNDQVLWWRTCHPTEAELNYVQETGTELVRTINRVLNEEQENVLTNWLEIHPEDRFRPVEENEEINNNNIINEEIIINEDNIINNEDNNNNIIYNIDEINLDNFTYEEVVMTLSQM